MATNWLYTYLNWKLVGFLIIKVFKLFSKQSNWEKEHESLQDGWNLTSLMEGKV